MALADLLRRIEAEADSQAAELMAAARAEGVRVVAEAAAGLSRRRALALAATESTLRAATAREVAAARRQAAAELLAARAAALGRVFDRLDAALVERRATPAVLDCAAADLGQAMEYLEGAGVARCRPELVEWLRGRLDASRLTIEADPSLGIGAVLRAADGSVQIDATVENRLERLRAHLAVNALRMLER
jgi:vacuolar-type H+-ATPase subunit E/Vma4